MIKIYLDPGHGGRKTGAVRQDISEKDLNLQICEKLSIILRGSDFLVHMSREEDKHLSLSHRAIESNHLEYDVFVSLHCNSVKMSNVEGFECFYYSEEGKAISDSIFKSVQTNTNKEHRASKKGTFYLLRKTKALAVYVECGFMSNPTELHLLKQNQYQWLVAEGIAKGLIKWRDKK